MTSDVPDDGNNAAQASATLPIPDLQAGDASRSTAPCAREETRGDGTGGHMGAAVMHGPPARSSAPTRRLRLPGDDSAVSTRTVPVPQLALNSDGPTRRRARCSRPSRSRATGTVVASGIVQAFDFYD